MDVHVTPQRAQLFRYVGFSMEGASLLGRYELDGVELCERVDFEGIDSMERVGVRGLAQLWYVLAGLSYYKAGAARTVDFGELVLGERSRAFINACFVDGLGEFSFRNSLDLADLRFVGGREPGWVPAVGAHLDPERVLIPFGGGIDSVVSVEMLNPSLDRALFIVSPASGRFAPLEATATATGLPVVRATRTLDPRITTADERFFHGHVPVTAMITLLACVAAAASGRGAVVMSNEHSASVDNLHWNGRGINHQWSKSYAAEVVLGSAVGETMGQALRVASFLRDRSELWVAKRFSELPQYHGVFRSCNRAFRQNAAQRPSDWCGECDKCLFINLMLAPFLDRSALREIFHGEPLANPDLRAALATLVGVGVEHKPFECVGDRDECASALVWVAALEQWRDVSHLNELAALVRATPPLLALLEPQGDSRVPAHWLR